MLKQRIINDNMQNFHCAASMINLDFYSSLCSGANNHLQQRELRSNINDYPMDSWWRFQNGQMDFREETWKFQVQIHY